MPNRLKNSYLHWSCINSCLKVKDMGSLSGVDESYSIHLWVDEFQIICVFSVSCCVCPCTIRFRRHQGHARLPDFSKMPPYTSNVIFPWKNSHFLYRLSHSVKTKTSLCDTRMFTAESSLDVGADLCAFCNLFRDVWPLSFRSLRYWVKTQPTCSSLTNNHTNLQLQPSRALNLSSDHFPSLLKDLKIHIAHTQTLSTQVQIRVIQCGWTSAVLPKAWGSRSMQGLDSQRGPLHCYIA